MTKGTVTHHEDGSFVFASEDTGRSVVAVQRDAPACRPMSWHVVYSDGRQMAGEWDRWPSLYELLCRWVLVSDDRRD